MLKTKKKTIIVHIRNTKAKTFSILITCFIIIDILSVSCFAFKSSPGLSVEIVDKNSLENVAYFGSSRVALDY